MTDDIARKHDFSLSVGRLEKLLKHHMPQILLSYKEKEAIFESFKVKQSIEDNPDNIDERLVSLHALVNARKTAKLKRIDQLIMQEADDEQAIEDIKTKGLQQMEADFIIQLATSKPNNFFGGIFKSIKKIDKDSNGFVTMEELDEIFREWYPLEMEGKTLNRHLKKVYGSVSNRNLINYKQMKAEVLGKVKLPTNDSASA